MSTGATTKDKAVSKKGGRGAALGIAFCGGSIGNIFLQSTTQAILKHYMTGNTKTGHLTSMAPFFIFAVAFLVIGI